MLLVVVNQVAQVIHQAMNVARWIYSLLLLNTEAVSYLAIYEQGGSADIFSLFTGGGGAEMTLLRALWSLRQISGGATTHCHPPPPARYGPVRWTVYCFSIHQNSE